MRAPPSSPATYSHPAAVPYHRRHPRRQPRRRRELPAAGRGEWVDGSTTFWDVVCFGPQAEHAIASLTKAARVIMLGIFRTRAWTDSDGGERTRLEVLADEIGPSLRWATTTVSKTGAADRLATARTRDSVSGPRAGDRPVVGGRRRQSHLENSVCERPVFARRKLGRCPAPDSGTVRVEVAQFGGQDPVGDHDVARTVGHRGRGRPGRLVLMGAATRPSLRCEVVDGPGVAAG